MQVQLAELATALTAESIPVVVLKGAYLAHIVYPSLALRDMQDIDLLVPREHLDRVTAVALARGYTPLRPFLVEQEAAAMHHLTRLEKPDALSIEIHWNITTPNQIYSINPTILWTHAVPVQIAGSGVLGLSAEHLLLHLCAHVSYQHGFEFWIRSLVDIATTIHRFDGELDWQFVEHQCRAWSWQRGVHLTLYLARELLGAAVPNDLLDTLSFSAIALAHHGNSSRHRSVCRSAVSGRSFSLARQARPNSMAAATSSSSVQTPVSTASARSGWLSIRSAVAQLI